MDQDLQYMQRALRLSLKGEGRTCPNPMVGAVIVKEGRIIGEGWHHGPGLPHAEVEALNACREEPKGATLYVTLEPCNHYGRTPPCTEAIIRAGITTVKMALTDPNPAVAGGGAARLRAAGIQVVEGIAKKEALEINRQFCHLCLTERPWVIMKAAMSLDGKIATATGASQWITSEPARRLVHKLRSQTGAVLIGRGTMEKDNPSLTNRLTRRHRSQPLKVLLDSELKIPIGSNLLVDPHNLMIFCAKRAPRGKEEELQKIGAQVIRQSTSKSVDLISVLRTLGSLGIQGALVEGGSEVFASFLEADLVNEFYLFYAPFFIGGDQAKGVIGGNGIADLNAAPRLVLNSVKKVGPDLLIHAYREELSDCLPV